MKMWVAMMRDAKAFPMDRMLPTGMTHAITPGELAAYKAPFPDPSYEAGICEFPMLIAVQPDNPGGPANREAWKKLGRFEKPFLTLFGAKDPVTRGEEKRRQEHVPGTSRQPHHVFPEASHFIQEDVPDDQVAMLDEIRKLFPKNCRFANYTINIKAVRDDTGIQFLAAVPVCSVENNWKSF